MAHDPLRRVGVFELGDQLIVGGHEMGPGTLSDRLMSWMKKRAHAFFVDRAQEYASQLGLGFKRVSVRDTSSRWGSCSSKGTLSFSWRLILAPLHVADYVVVHEVCHLKEMNHSPKFWGLVAQCPTYQQDRRGLKSMVRLYIAVSASYRAAGASSWTIV